MHDLRIIQALNNNETEESKVTFINEETLAKLNAPRQVREGEVYTDPATQIRKGDRVRIEPQGTGGLFNLKNAEFNSTNPAPVSAVEYVARKDGDLFGFIIDGSTRRAFCAEPAPVEEFEWPVGTIIGEPASVDPRPFAWIRGKDGWYIFHPGAEIMDPVSASAMTDASIMDRYREGRLLIIRLP